MSFIINNGLLPYPKVQLNPLPSGANPANYPLAADWNAVCQALIDTKTFLRGGFQLFTDDGSATVGFRVYNGSPDGVLTDQIGALCVDTADILLYQNADGGTGWVQIGATAGTPSNVPVTFLKTSLAANVSGVAVAPEFYQSDSMKWYVAARAGSIVGLSTALSQAITGGTCTTYISINGTSTDALSIVQTSSAMSQYGSDTQGPGSNTYNAGDRIGVSVTTSSDFTAAGTTNLYAWVQVVESL